MGEISFVSSTKSRCLSKDRGAAIPDDTCKRTHDVKCRHERSIATAIDHRDRRWTIDDGRIALMIERVVVDRARDHHPQSSVVNRQSSIDNSSSSYPRTRCTNDAIWIVGRHDIERGVIRAQCLVASAETVEDLSERELRAREYAVGSWWLCLDDRAEMLHR